MTSSTTGATASQAWAILKRHARDEIAPLRLHELCRDNDRVSSLVAVYKQNDADAENGDRIFLIDFSRQRMTLETMNHLLRLATARQVKKFITRLAWGQNDPDHPIVPLSIRQQQEPTAVAAAAAAAQKAALYDSTKNKTTRFSHSGSGAFDVSRSGSGSGAGRLRHRTDTADKFSVLPSMHLALRAPRGRNLQMLTADGNNALISIHREWDRIERLSDSIRRGQMTGVTGSTIRDVVVVGRGVPCMALRFVYEALCKDETAIAASRMGLSEATSSRIRRGIAQATASSGVAVGAAVSSAIGGTASQTPVIAPRRMKFLSSIDPIAAASIISDLDPASTLVISIALRGNEETGIATQTMKTWLLQSLGSSRRPDLVLGKHMMLVTGNDRIATAINKPESVFVVPDHSRCEGFTSFSVATLLPLAIVFGWPIVENVLAGGHDMDSHFVETNPRHNLPVLLALTDVWNDAFFASSGRVVTPYTEALAAFPAFVGALEAQTCSKSTITTEALNSTLPHNSNGSTATVATNFTGVPTKSSCSAMVIDGGMNSTYDRALFQSGKVMNSELVMVMNTQITANAAQSIGVHAMEDIHSAQDALICSFFAHADEMAFGSEKPTSHPFLSSPMSSGGGAESSSFADETEYCEGNRPSTLLLLGKCDAYACGQLLALSEHRAVVKARIWDMDPFTTEIGSSIKANRAEKLRDGLQKLFTDGVENSQEEEDEENAYNENGMNLSTKTILGHYANLTRDRMYAVNS